MRTPNGSIIPRTRFPKYWSKGVLKSYPAAIITDSIGPFVSTSTSITMSPGLNYLGIEDRSKVFLLTARKVSVEIK